MNNTLEERRRARTEDKHFAKLKATQMLGIANSLCDDFLQKYNIPDTQNVRNSYLLMMSKSLEDEHAHQGRVRNPAEVLKIAELKKAIPARMLGDLAPDYLSQKGIEPIPGNVFAAAIAYPVFCDHEDLEDDGRILLGNTVMDLCAAQDDYFSVEGSYPSSHEKALHIALLGGFLKEVSCNIADNEREIPRWLSHVFCLDMQGGNKLEDNCLIKRDILKKEYIKHTLKEFQKITHPPPSLV